MYITNTHERLLQAPAEKVGVLIDSLSSKEDMLWPTSCWPRMILDKPLGIGARGGHGPIGYEVEMYLKSQMVRFRFLAPKGFDGFHEFRLIPHDDKGVILRHTIEMRTSGYTTLSWIFIYGPMHNSLLEDSLAKGQHVLGLTLQIVGWSPWVKLLRRILAKGKVRPQTIS